MGLQAYAFACPEVAIALKMQSPYILYAMKDVPELWHKAQNVANVGIFQAPGKSSDFLGNSASSTEGLNQGSVDPWGYMMPTWEGVAEIGLG